MHGDDGTAIMAALEVIKKGIDRGRLQFWSYSAAGLLRSAQNAQQIVHWKIVVLFKKGAGDLDAVRHHFDFV